MKTCPECDGYGQYLGEKAIVDYVNGGFYDEVLVECEECEGSGEVKKITPTPKIKKIMW